MYYWIVKILFFQVVAFISVCLPCLTIYCCFHHFHIHFWLLWFVSPCFQLQLLNMGTCHVNTCLSFKQVRLIAFCVCTKKIVVGYYPYLILCQKTASDDAETLMYECCSVPVQWVQCCCRKQYQNIGRRYIHILSFVNISIGQKHTYPSLHRDVKQLSITMTHITHCSRIKHSAKGAGLL